MADQIGTWVLGLALVLGGIVVGEIGRRQRAGTLRRNWLAGLRTGETMSSDEAWNTAHVETAGLVIAAGIAQVARVLPCSSSDPTNPS